MDSFEESARLLRKMSSGSKLDVLRLLINGEQAFTEIQRELGIEQSLLSHHLKDLRDLKFLDSRRDGRKTIYSINTQYYKTDEAAIDLGCCKLQFKKG